jgi:hypothetical protein
LGGARWRARRRWRRNANGHDTHSSATPEVAIDSLGDLKESGIPEVRELEEISYYLKK